MRHRRFRSTRGGTVLGSVFVIVVGFGACPAPLQAADRPAAKADGSFDDLKLTGLARKALQQDKRLTGLNVGVTLSNGVATLWGRVPSAEVAKEAVDRLKQVPGVVKVVDTSKVVPPADPLAAQVAEALRSRGLQAEPPGAPETVTTAKVTGNKPDLDPLYEPDPPRAPAVASAKPTALRQPAGPAPAMLSKPEVLPDVSADFDGIWQRLQAKEERFREVTLERRDGVVRINGTVARMADAWELADLLAEAPGVRQVLLDKVQAR
jgi:hypothetical protein